MMTSPVSPAIKLRAAAALVREYAQGTTEGRRISADVAARTGRARATWQAWPSCEYDEDDPEFATEVGRGASGVQVSVPGGIECVAMAVPNWRDGRWIALLSPVLAEPLAAWLETAADYCAADQYAPTALVHDHPLAVARMLLGETS